MPASPAVLKQHAPVQQPQQPQQQKQAQIIHHFKPQGPHHSYAPGSTGAAQTMAWLHVHYPGVIDRRELREPHRPRALLPPRHVPAWSQASPLAVADYNNSAALL
eukprot:scaffold62912_cov65-Phaeocystis_antarctica.AAC.5